MKKVFDYFNGHKTIIFNTTAATLQQLVMHDIINDTKGVQFSISMCLVFGGGSLIHHIKKAIKK